MITLSEPIAFLERWYDRDDVPWDEPNPNFLLTFVQDVLGIPVRTHTREMFEVLPDNIYESHCDAYGEDEEHQYCVKGAYSGEYSRLPMTDSETALWLERGDYILGMLRYCTEEQIRKQIDEYDV